MKEKKTIGTIENAEDRSLVNESELFEFAEFDETSSEHIVAPRYSYWKSVWRTFVKNKFTVAVAILLILLLAFALIQPLFSGYDPMVAKKVLGRSHLLMAH